MTRAVGDRGQAAVLLIVVASVIFLVTTTALGVLGGRVVERTRAQTAADAAALVSLDGGRAGAELLAARHGAELVSWISSVMTLLPGDVILTGTPAGVGPLVAGDEVSVSIDGIGTLTNPVVDRD